MIRKSDILNERFHFCNHISIIESDYIIDLGPEGGRNGGEIVYEGTLENLLENKKSYTGRFLALEYKT